MDQVELCDRILYTLDKIQVQGIDNIDRLLGCARAVEQLKQELEKESKAQESKAQEVTVDGSQH